MTGAAVRAIWMLVLVCTPALLLPGLAPDTTQIVAFVALFAAAFVFIEYAAAAPVLIEFRFAPPFNRLRFAALLLAVLLLSLLCAGDGRGAAVAALAGLLGAALDFPFSPVRLAALMLPEGAPPRDAELLRDAAALAYAVMAGAVAVFALLLRRTRWPLGPAGFNLWTNLPSFGPDPGSDLVRRLDRDALVNLASGVLLPFVMPAAIRLLWPAAMMPQGAAPHALVWTVAACAFLPASLVMRGLALGRIARAIAAQREGAAGAPPRVLPAV